MKPAKSKINTVDDYIAKYPEEVQVLLEKIRTTIKKAAPQAEEIISYQMPALRFYSNLVYFGAFKNHISFFPTSSGIKAFKKDLLKYETSKGTIKFPLEKRIPLGLISKITKFRLKEEQRKRSIKNKR